MMMTKVETTVADQIPFYSLTGTLLGWWDTVLKFILLWYLCVTHIAFFIIFLSHVMTFLFGCVSLTFNIG